MTLWKNQSWILHHDNIPANISVDVVEFLAKNQTVIMPQPVYSPDLAPADYLLFPTIEEIKEKSKEELFLGLENTLA